MGKRGHRSLSERERAVAHMNAAEKYNDTGHIEKAVAHVKRAMHYGGSDIPRFGAPVEWRKITMHEGKVALFDVGTILTGDIDASSHIAAYEASDEGVDATETLKTGGIRVVPYLTHGHRMYFYYNYKETHIIAGLFVKPSTIDSAKAVKDAINMCKLIDSTDKQKKIGDLEANQSTATEQMKPVWEKQIAKIRGEIETSKSDLDEARRKDAIDWYAIVEKTNELARSEPGAELAQCILSHLARRKLLSVEELKRVARYSEQNVGRGPDATPYKGLVCVDHTGVSIADQSGNVRYVHTYVTRNKPDGSVRVLDVKNKKDTSALCDMRAASMRDSSLVGAQKGPIVYCIKPSGENQCTLFAEIGDEKTGAVSCIYVAPYFDTNDKLGQVSLLALSPVAAPLVTRDIAGAVTTANAIGIQGTTGERAFVSRVRLFLLLMHFQSFAPAGRAESFAIETKAGRCTAGISAQDASETTITINDHDPETKKITSTRVALTGTDTVLDALRIAMKLNQYDRIG